MKIRIQYGFYTDGDYSLRNSENFGCTGEDVNIEDKFFDYVGVKEFENEEEWRCKSETKSFLQELLCDGIHISYTHHYLIKDFYNIITSLINFINKNDIGELCEEISGNYEGTYIKIEFLPEFKMPSNILQDTIQSHNTLFDENLYDFTNGRRCSW